MKTIITKLGHKDLIKEVICEGTEKECLIAEIEYLKQQLEGTKSKEDFVNIYDNSGRIIR